MVLFQPARAIVDLWYAFRRGVGNGSYSYHISRVRTLTKVLLQESSLCAEAFQLLTKKDKTLATYCRDFKAICDSLTAIGNPIEELMKIFGFSMVLQENMIL